MGLTTPINGLQYSTTGGDNDYYDMPVAPASMEIELEQVTANSYRSVDTKVTLHNDFLGIISKVNVNYGNLSFADYHTIASLFYRNTFIYLRFFHPKGDETFYKGQFKCGNLKGSAELLKNGLPQLMCNVTQSYTQKEAG